eukprot:1166775-Pleurochrysis_carterae.AAC.1
MPSTINAECRRHSTRKPLLISNDCGIKRHSRARAFCCPRLQDRCVGRPASSLRTTGAAPGNGAAAAAQPCTVYILPAQHALGVTMVWYGYDSSIED